MPRFEGTIHPDYLIPTTGRPYEALACAIVERACLDWSEFKAHEKRGKHYEGLNPITWEYEITLFFRSHWFRMLTDLDPVTLFEKVKELSK